MSVSSPSFISFNILVNTLHPSSLFICYACLCFVVGVVNKLRLWYEGTPKYLGKSVTGMKFGLRIGRRGLGASIVTRDSGIDAGRCADKLWHFLWTCAVVFPLEDQSRWSWCHEMMSQWSLMLFWEGTIKGEHTQTSGLSSGVSDTEWLGLLTSQRTLYSSYLGASHGADHNQNELCVLFIHMHVPRPFLEFLVSMTLVVWH